MIKKTVFIACLGSLILGCQKDKTPDPFEISKNKIGHLTNEVKVYQLDSIFKDDSIVKPSLDSSLLIAKPEIEIYEKGGAKLLILEPEKGSDPESTIENIQIIDPKYHTPAGLSANSIFKDIKDHYKISKINNTLSTAVIFVDSIQAYLTIDKKELPSEFRLNTDTKIEASHIPDSAKIKHFWISWDGE